MARASRTKTLSGGPQGSNARVVLLLPTIGEMREQRKITQQLIKNFGDSSEEVEDNANVYVANHIVQWNWVDDEDVVFELPSKNVKVFDLLTQEEINFIARGMAGQDVETADNRKK